jgi:hypothetical protein
MGHASQTGGMKRGSTVKSLYTKSKATKAKRQKKEYGEFPKASGMNECFTHGLPRYEMTEKEKKNGVKRC